VSNQEKIFRKGSPPGWKNFPFHLTEEEISPRDRRRWTPWTRWGIFSPFFLDGRGFLERVILFPVEVSFFSPPFPPCGKGILAKGPLLRKRLPIFFEWQLFFSFLLARSGASFGPRRSFLFPEVLATLAASFSFDRPLTGLSLQTRHPTRRTMATFFPSCLADPASSPLFFQRRSFPAGWPRSSETAAA